MAAKLVSGLKSRTVRLFGAYQLENAFWDLVWAYFPVLVVALVLLLTEHGSLLFARADLMLISTILFGEGLRTARRARRDVSLNDMSLNDTWVTLGFASGLILVVLTLVYEVSALEGPPPPFLARMVHSTQYQYMQAAFVLFALGYGFWIRVRIYQAMEGKEKVDTFETAASIKFYNLVAADYHRDYQTKPELQDTYAVINEQISRALPGTSGYKVLDLGGGTGFLTVSYRTRRDLEWTHCDPSEGMVMEFKRSFGSSDLNPKIKQATIQNAHDILPKNHFDVVILAFVLSSLDRLPDFSGLRGLLNDNGVLIIADADLVGQSDPLLKVELKKEKKQLGLRLYQVDPLELVIQLFNAGFCIKQSPRRIFRRKDQIETENEEIPEAFVLVLNLDGKSHDR